ncbi:fungal-specific transcription factor-like protein [Lophiostoma macrostomum CBS 122681]|uniref:Fungal-specific transcription factor-like protein n=1 Tax=Lophiostoma macrostomum CBS 122681 TaxID=1314788 RepID=A0A6A6T9C6_9PLEO|nr:fungal-specific transcription factor-like protein [Lophiostoma macrostomum CBS 122681]
MAQKRAHGELEHADTGRRPSAPKPARTRACVECKRHKIRCETVEGEQKCSKCLRSGAECVPYNINHKLQEEDALWKAKATAEIAQLRSAVQQLLRHNQLPPMRTDVDQPSTVVISPTNVVSENGCTAMVVPPMDMTRENSPERSVDEEDTNLVPAPMRSLYDLTRIRNLRSNARWKTNASALDDDFITQGIISPVEADELFKRYMENIHELLWAGMLCPHSTLEQSRRHSTLLTAAIITIAALHTPGGDETLLKCYNVFVSLAYSTCLSRVHNLDDIRALVLAAFYLPSLSWKLSGIAVRNAVELNIHHSFQKLMRGQTEHRGNVRLWYALYVCEHQFSIAYGRPPLIHPDAAINNVEDFLNSPLSTPGEVRICAQVALFKILTEAYLAYGSDPEQALTESDFQQLRMFNFAIEQWRLAWQHRSADSASIGSYPSKGIVLYYHFARFQLNSLALRALPAPSAASSESLSYDRREAANIAIAAATSTLTLIFEEPDLRKALPGVPIFTHTMVAFCATFLLKMAKTWGGVVQAASPEWATEPVGLGLNFHIGQVLSLSRRSAHLLSKVADGLNEKHLTRHIVAGIRDLLKHFDAIETPRSTGPLGIEHRQLGGALTTQSMDIASEFPSATVDPMAGWNMYDLIGSYGFGFDETYLGQAASSDLDLWPM